MNKVKSIIAKNLVELRKQHKYTQAEIAQKLNYSDKAISKWETGETLPDIDVLCKLCELYDVSFDYLIHEGTPSDKKDFVNVKSNKSNVNNKLIISLLYISIVWILASILYVYANLISNLNFWQVFVWAIPLSCILSLIFNELWGKRMYKIYLLSVLVWSALISVYLHFIEFNIWPIFLVGIPLQLSFLLWDRLKK